MPRLGVLVSLGAVVLVGVAASGTPPGTAQEGTPMPAASGFVGSWRLTVAPPVGQPHPGLLTFAADGTLLVADVPVQPAPPGAPVPAVYFSGGHGAWEATAADAAAFTFDLLLATEQGAALGTLTLRGVATLGADRRTLDGTYVGAFTDPAGQAGAAGQGSFRGTRLTVEPMDPPPAATPATG